MSESEVLWPRMSEEGLAGAQEEVCEGYMILGWLSFQSKPVSVSQVIYVLIFEQARQPKSYPLYFHEIIQIIISKYPTKRDQGKSKYQKIWNV